MRLASIALSRGLSVAALTLTLLYPASRAPAQPGEIAVDQGGQWTSDAKKAFYKADQGSRIMPYAWMAALKQKDGTPFLSDGLKRYGYLDDPSDAAKLPVGFMLAGEPGQQEVGMTCAACHTRQLAVGNQLYRIDGGPGFVDFQAFLEDIDKAVGAVLATDASFQTFAEAVLASAKPAAGDVAALKKIVNDWYVRYHALIEGSLRPGQKRWGLGRLDAVAMMFNRVTGLDLGPEPSYLIPENIQPADAPTRYPFLWNAPKQDHTQWSGFAENGDDAHALARNVGQVLGVFGKFSPKKSETGIDFLYKTSIDFVGLSRIEQLVKKIGAPKWPWAIDTSLAAKGAQIYARPKEDGGCASCHSVSVPEQGPWPTPIENVKTDTRQYAILRRAAKSGVLEGVPFPAPPETGNSQPLMATDAAIKIFITSAVGSIRQFEKSHAGGHAPSNAAGGGASSESRRAIAKEHPLDYAYRAQRAAPPAREAAHDDKFGTYEARVLYGVWAAAPYLHNGSVPSLTQLLVPPKQREKSFKVGPQYDAKTMGLAKDQPSTAQEFAATTCDEPLDTGNSNCGHDYGTSLTADEKLALLEYLKTL